MKIKNIISALLVALFMASCAQMATAIPNKTTAPTSTITPAPLTPTSTITPTSTPAFTIIPIPTSDLRIRNPENSHLYLFVEVYRTWHSASYHCRSRGGHLVTIENSSENDFVYNLSGGQTWLGMSDENQEGIWKWVTDEPVNYTNWAQSEPNNCTQCTGTYLEEGEDFAHFNDNPSDKWNDWPSEESKFICEWETSK